MSLNQSSTIAGMTSWAERAQDSEDLCVRRVAGPRPVLRRRRTRPRDATASPTRRLIARAKEFVEANLSRPIRLVDVAREVGVSPAYLTDAFRRIEGVPLHRYLVQRRLARALAELPHATDLTRLALDLGFSSHSHFTAAFRRAYGVTPSRCRADRRIPAA